LLAGCWPGRTLQYSRLGPIMTEQHNDNY